MVSPRNQQSIKETTTMKTVAKKARRIKRQRALLEMTEVERAREVRMAAIQMLIPVAMSEALSEMQAEFAALVGERYARGKTYGPWGSNAGSIYLGDQKVAVKVPRVRNREYDEEMPLKSYQRLQNPAVIDELALNRVINGVSAGKYERAALSIPETFGISRDSVSRRFKRSSAKKLVEMNERDLSGYDIVAMFLDGKHFGTDHEIVIALGITIDGEKVILGMIETSTENYAVCRDFLNSLLKRGLRVEKPILCLIDGGKGLRKGVDQVLGEKAIVGRCQWHKRENVLQYLPKSRQDEFRRKLQNAYEQTSYDAAKKTFAKIRSELVLINASAVNSLDEGFEETLILQRLGMAEKLKKSFRTTNCIENVNAQLAIYTDRVSYWKNSEQRQRWVATSLIEIEPRLHKVSGHQHLRELRLAMAQFVRERNNGQELKQAA
jgi:transposase-like protein